MDTRSSNQGRRRFGARGASLLVLLVAVAGVAPLIGTVTTASAQYGGITPRAPYDQSRRVARRTARRTSRRQYERQQQYEEQYQQPYQQPSPPPNQYPNPYPNPQPYPYP
jgi:hypothetical protein